MGNTEGHPWPHLQWNYYNGVVGGAKQTALLTILKGWIRSLHHASFGIPFIKLRSVLYKYAMLSQ